VSNGAPPCPTNQVRQRIGIINQIRAFLLQRGIVVGEALSRSIAPAQHG